MGISKGKRAIREYKGNQVRRGRKGILARKAQRENRDPRENQGRRVHRARKAKPDRRDHKGRKGNQGRAEARRKSSPLIRTPRQKAYMY